MPLVEVSHLVKHFVRNAGLLRKGTPVTAVDDVSFAIEVGETFGLVGESGSGKTTTGRCILRLVEPTSGSVRFRGEDVLGFSRRRMREARREIDAVIEGLKAKAAELPRLRPGLTTGDTGAARAAARAALDAVVARARGAGGGGGLSSIL